MALQNVKFSEEEVEADIKTVLALLLLRGRTACKSTQLMLHSPPISPFETLLIGLINEIQTQSPILQLGKIPSSRRACLVFI